MNIFSGSILDYVFLLVFGVFSAGLSLFLYYNIEITTFRKAILVTLRAVSLFLMFTLLLNPFAVYLKNNFLNNQNIILIDKSFSSEIDNRDTVIKDILKDITKRSNNFKLYTFGSRLIKEVKEYNIDTSKNYKYSTNLSSTFDEILTKNENQINSINIISDGIINEGENLLQTAYKLRSPINYNLIGDTTQKKDLLVKRVNFNKKQFTNSKSNVYVTINSYLINKAVNISLYENDKKIRTNTIFVNDSNYEYETIFEVTSANQDIKKYKIEIESEEGEITTFNNQEIFYIKYIDNTIKMLLIAGSPSSDITALRNALNISDNFKYDIRIQKNSNEFYEGDLPEFKKYDIIILVGFPTDKSSEDIINKVKHNIQNAKLPLIFINSSNLSLEKLAELKDLLPFVYNDAGKSEIKGNIMFPSGNVNEKTESFRKLKILPPSIFYRGAFSSKPNSTILAFQNNEPAIVADISSEIKSSAFLGYGFYKWNLNPNGNYDFLRNLLSGFVSLCINEDAKERFTIKCDKDNYAISEPVKFLAYYRDTDPLKKYNVRLNFGGGENINIPELSRLGENNFQGETQLFKKGDYTVKADLYENDILLQSNILKFSVTDALLEYKETKALDKTLRELANLTRGFNLSDKNNVNIDSIFNSNMSRNDIFENKSLFRNSFLYLILIIVLLSIEWYIRKRLNLA